MKTMRKGLFFLTICLAFSVNAIAATNYIPKRFNTVTSHDDVYPYRLNNARPNPTNTTTTSTSTANSVAAAPVGKRNVVKRQTRARAATNSTTSTTTATTTPQRRVVQRTNSANQRSAVKNTAVRPQEGRTSQNVVTRSAKNVQTRTTKSVREGSANYYSGEKVSSDRCFADYKECMESYCEREDTAYNRCYCSAKLAQIDSKYQNKIDDLIQQIARLRYDSSVDSDEIKEYWNQTVGSYTGTNPWVNIENALNIEWADSQSRVRGQNAFNTGHEYCVRHLRSCYYMASNLRDAYKSEIARDCDTYEKSLQKIQAAAESVIESYKNN